MILEKGGDKIFAFPFSPQKQQKALIVVVDTNVFISDLVFIKNLLSMRLPGQFY